jgi:hypothetical protein
VPSTNEATITFSYKKEVISLSNRCENLQRLPEVKHFERSMSKKLPIVWKIADTESHALSVVRRSL